MTRLTTHVLDTAAGHPAAGLRVSLAASSPGGDWQQVAEAVTDADGRVGPLPDLEPGTWRLSFDTRTPFFPEVVVTFAVTADREHLHVPLLLSPYGYSVYRGS
jgi:5-hydroxyisourate hydrolase